MFLKKVNQHSKWLFIIMIIVIIAQLFIGYKHGMVISPFFNYGMYSEVINIKNTYQIFEVEQNGKRLRGQDFSAEQWDKIMLPLQYFTGIHASNEVYKNDIKRLLAKIHVPVSDSNFLSWCNYQEFEDWYKKYLETVTNQPTKSVSINYRLYQYQSNKLEPSNSFLPLSQLCH